MLQPDLNRLQVNLGRIGILSSTLIAIEVQRAAFLTVAGAQTIVPVRTGNLKNSIGCDIDPNHLGFEAGPTASYGAHVEFGTSRSAPRAYMGPAFDRVMAASVARMEQLLVNEIERRL